MCGIFAYIGNQLLSIQQVLELMRLLEKDQEQGEKNPVGGHGAGIAYLNQRNEFTFTKVGRTNGSAVDTLSRQIEHNAESSTLVLAHVRHASPEFQHTIKHAECTQPYKPTCTKNLTVFTAHNGYLENYQQLKNNLTGTHYFESEKTQLIDSEVIAHVFEEALTKQNDPTKAAHTLYEQTQGTDTQGNTIVTVTHHKRQTRLDAIQKGKTRGLVIWTNPQNETIISTREKPTQQTLGAVIAKNHYQKIIDITRNDTTNAEIHFNP